MKGWTPDGTEVELTNVQERMVTALLSWSQDNGSHIALPAMGRQSGRSVILATAARYDRIRSGVMPSDYETKLFIGEVFAADQVFRSMSKAEATGLPDKYVRAWWMLQSAVERFRHPRAHFPFRVGSVVTEGDDADAARQQEGQGAGQEEGGAEASPAAVDRM